MIPDRAGDQSIIWPEDDRTGGSVPAAVAPRKDDDVTGQEGQAKPGPPVQRMSAAVAHPEMQIDRGALLGGETGGEGGRQAAEKARQIMIRVFIRG